MAMPMSARATREASTPRANAAALAAVAHIMPGGEPVFVPPAPKNPLLVRDGVGRAKPSCYDLPGQSFSYGRPGNHDVEGAREVSMCWSSHMPSRVPAPTAPNFVKLNMKATSAMITSAKELANFRREQEQAAQNSLKAPRGQSTGGRRAVIPSDVIENYTYGQKVRPSTPINDVMANSFAATAEEELCNYYTQSRKQAETSKQHVRKIQLTAASRGHAAPAKKVQGQAGESTKEQFKLSKFKKVDSKTMTGNRRPKAEYDRDVALANDAEVPGNLSGSPPPRECEEEFDASPPSEV